jgi:DNA-binding MarR family transcriptional regulator
VLASNSGISQKQIILETGLSERAVRNNLKQLEEFGLISSSRDVHNLNFKRYKINENGAVV